MQQPRLSFGQIGNMNVAYLGIQFGWGLQMANMSAIYEYLGARAEQIPILWLAAPLTGLLIQPVVGQLSDRTWNRLGRRRPYLFFGALASCAALVLMPNAGAIWVAAALLWLLDGSINVSMQPLRALVADVLPEEQHDTGFAMQSVFIGLGSVVASALPWLMRNVLGVTSAVGGAHAAIPLTVTLSFYVGAAAFVLAVLWTVVTTREYPPQDLEAFRREQRQSGGLGRQLGELLACVMHMPRTMRELALVQVFTWLGLFCMWMYFPVAIARSVFGAPDESSPLYAQGIEWGGVCFAAYSAVTFVFAFALPRLAQRLGRRLTHALCLLCGAAGLVAVVAIHDRWVLLLAMAGVGVAWASIVSLPYAILAGSLPKQRIGVYMGIFNLFIVLPEIAASLLFGPLMKHGLHNDRLLAVVTGGVCLLIAAALMRFVEEGTARSAEGAASAGG